MSRPLLQTILKTIPADCRPGSGQRFVIGISGGPDSTALAHLMRELSDAENYGWRLHLAHLNHGLRGIDSERDARFVTDLAAQHGWEVSVETPPVSESADRSGVTLEEAARNQRYAFFERVARKTAARIVATAHHADDNVETVMHRLIRGTGIRGLAGIPAVRPLSGSGACRLIRPLLNIRRAEILAYLKENNIPFCHDHTNEITEFTRNRIRNDLLPTLEQHYNPAVSEALLRLAEQSRWLNEFLQELVEAKFPELVVERDGAGPPTQITLDAAALLREPRALQTELTRHAITTLGVGEKKLSFDHLISIIELAEKNVSGKRLELPAGLTVSYDRKKLTFARSTNDRSRSRRP